MSLTPSYILDCLQRDVIFLTGKGGVGKSTIAWATAQACAELGKKVAVASWNPLETKAQHFPPEFEPVLEPHLRWIPLEVGECFKEYVSRILKFETLYHVVFENHVLQTFIRATPGIAETVLAGKIWDLWHQKAQDLLIVDLPSSGHALSFFQSPLGVHKIFAAGFVHQESEKIMKLFQSSKIRVDLVALPEELPLVEAKELKRKLEQTFPLHFGFLQINQCTPNFQEPDVIPEAAQSTINRHHERLLSEREALAVATEIDLPLVKIPRFATSRSQATRQSVKEALEKA